MKNSEYLKIALKLTLICGKTFKKYFGRAGKIQSKSPQTDPRNFVTKIDRKIEQYFRCELLKKFPTHKFIGEEFGQQSILQNEFYWVIDPIDGTNNYIQGIPQCCISIALWQNNSPIVAIVYNPITKELFTAIKGQGAFLNKKKISVSKTSSLKTAYGGVGWSQNKNRAIKLIGTAVNSLGKVRSLGSNTLQMCYVANGNFDFFITSDIKFWDFAAALLIVNEAKGICTEFQNKNLEKNSLEMICCCPKIHKNIISILKNI